MQRIFSEDLNRNYTDFLKEEYEQRYARARILMEEQRLSALLITEESNYIYFTGHRSPESPNGRRMLSCWVFILPRKGEPVAIVPSFEVNYALRGTWMRDVRVGSQAIRHPVGSPGLGHSEAIAETIKDIGLADGRIGCELGIDQILGISYSDFVKVKELLPRTTFVDAAGILNNLRAVKSKAEVEICRKAARITARAAQKTFEEIREGMSGLEVVGVAISNMIKEGAEDANLLMTNGFDLVKEKGIGAATEKPLREGETVTLDMHARYKGYWSDMSRTFVVGKPLEKQRRAYKYTREIQEKCYEALKPGVTTDEFVHFCIKAQANADPEYTVDKKIQTSGTYGGSCHGVGLCIVEYPFLSLGQKVTLQPGMVLSFNPTFTTSFGYFNVEEMVAITDDECEILSTPESAEELPVI